MNMKRWLIFIFVGMVVCVHMAKADMILFSGTLNYSEDFSSLGTGDVTWNDGNSVQGWYLRAATNLYSGANSDGVPNTVYGRNFATLGSSGAAYHIGDTTNRALSWVRTSATGLVYIGNQFQNDGDSDTFDVNVQFNMEQWRSVVDSSSTLTLQYRVTPTGGNILTTSGWTTVGPTASLPNTAATGNVDGHLPANQFTLGGSITNLSIAADNFLTFRIVGNVPNGAGFGVGSADISIIPEPGTFMLSMLGLMLLFYRSIRGRC